MKTSTRVIDDGCGRRVQREVIFRCIFPPDSRYVIFENLCVPEFSTIKLTDDEGVEINGNKLTPIMDSKPKHSPLPWKWEGIKGLDWIEDTNGEAVLDGCGGRDGGCISISEEDAEFIARACNNHYAMVAAIEDVLAARKAFFRGGTDFYQLGASINRLETALKQAKGGE